MQSRKRAGFTLLELLAVIMIIAILAGVLISQLGGAENAAFSTNTKTLMQTIETIAGEYEIEHGSFPRSSFTPEQGVGNDGENVGIEALVVAFYSDKWDAGGHEIEESSFGNTDEDLSARSLTDFGNRKLLEFVDAWKNPIAYIYRTDYGTEDRIYVTVDDQGEVVRGTPKAWKDPVQGQFYKHNRFQLISAGPNGVFDNDVPGSDDITNFDRP